MAKEDLFFNRKVVKPVRGGGHTQKFNDPYAPSTQQKPINFE